MFQVRLIEQSDTCLKKIIPLIVVNNPVFFRGSPISCLFIPWGLSNSTSIVGACLDDQENVGEDDAQLRSGHQTA